MADEKSVEQIAAIIEKRVKMELISQLPNPSCALKRQRNEWKKNEVIKTVVIKLNESIGSK
ncbi:hypothetical protein UFOVP217_17 [uncultured Caudovirales phage]|jgi:hypothetical protein|uniref:Uncharacterized protein n=1 Tax=uncultured Caudovirales phage TaxID=2100421 RepID=A0A6J7WQN3_9CAUD|nr:hypothetical protein UFOVP217_17 [uncultured Caudovirales phage]